MDMQTMERVMPKDFRGLREFLVGFLSGISRGIRKQTVEVAALQKRVATLEALATDTEVIQRVMALEEALRGEG